MDQSFFGSREDAPEQAMIFLGSDVDFSRIPFVPQACGSQKAPPAKAAKGGGERDAYGEFLGRLCLCRTPEHIQDYVKELDGWLTGLDGDRRAASALDIVERQTARLLLRVVAELDVELQNEDREYNRPPLPKASAFPARASALREERDRLAERLADLKERRARTERLERLNRKAAAKAARAARSGPGRVVGKASSGTPDMPASPSLDGATPSDVLLDAAHFEDGATVAAAPEAGRPAHTQPDEKVINPQAVANDRFPKSIEEAARQYFAEQASRKQASQPCSQDATSG